MESKITTNAELEEDINLAESSGYELSETSDLKKHPASNNAIIEEIDRIKARWDKTLTKYGAGLISDLINLKQKILGGGE